MSQDPKEIRKNLSETLDEAEWSLLKAHAERDALILVNPSLNLLDVAERMALDDRLVVGGWISSHQIAKPIREQLEAWDIEPSKRFLCVVVQPFVLAQEITDFPDPASPQVH